INNININDPAATAPFDLNHTNYYDWRWNHGKVINDDDRYESSTITISAWFRLEEGRGANNVSYGWQESSGLTTSTDSGSANFLIIGKLGVTGDTAGAGDEGVNNISISNTANSLVFVTEDPAGVNISKIVTAPANLADGKWHHVVFVRNGNTFGQFYLDGVAIGNDTMTPDAGFTTDDNNPYNIQIGFDKNMARYFQGQIANVAVWNSALTDTDVTALYNNPTSASILSSAFLRVYFPPNSQYPDTNTAVSYTTSTLKDINNYNTTAPASYFKHYQANIGSNLTITPTWRYADSGSFQFPAGFIFALPAIATIISDRLREFTKSAEKILPAIKEVYAQQNFNNNLKQACTMADILPILGITAVIIAGVMSFIDFRREGGSNI
ncbi:MAG: LamG domain-containing protein, partial [Ignisphaera sp.]